MIPRFLQSRWPSVLWTALIFVLLVMPDSGIPKHGMLGISNLDKLAHVILFGVFVILWQFRLELSNDRAEINTRMLLSLFLLSSGYGIVMEFVQLGFTNRAFEGWDIAADIAGAAAAALGIFWARKSPYGNRGRNQN